MPQSGTSSAAAGVRAVERAVELLVRLGERDGGASLHQLAVEVGCSKSTVHRLLATLERLEVVEREPGSRRFRLGPRLQELSRESWAQIDLRQVALPFMQQLRDESQETVTLHLRDGDAHVVVEQCESPQEIRRILPLGQRIPLVIGATAKAILAFLPPEESKRLLADTRADEQPGPTLEELDDIRSLGYAFSLAERVPGGSAISAPVFDRHGLVCAALSVSGPSFRFTPARATRFAPRLVRAAYQISARLGHTPRKRLVVTPERLASAETA